MGKKTPNLKKLNQQEGFPNPFAFKAILHGE